MSVARLELPIGELVQRAWEDALESWVRDNARGQDPEVFLTTECRNVAVTISATVGAPVYAYVEVSGKRPWHSGTYGYRLERPGKRSAGGYARRVL